jgi:hypothetical protein
MLQRVFLAVLFTAAAIVAQTVTGTVSGSVTDNSGAVLVAAEVKLTNDTTGVPRTARTNETGTFVFAAVPPGAYSLAVEVKGFRPARRTGITVTANERLALGTIELEVGQLTESVEVVAQAATVNVESAENTAMLSSKQMDTMLARGRDVANLLRILPGVAQNTEGPQSLGERFGTALPNIAGTRSTWMTTTLDGQVGSDPHIVGTFNGATSIDAIAEVKVVLNTYSAEYGRNSGPTINLVTKSGGRDFHGTAYWYKRHEMFNANDFFNNRSNLPKPVYRFGNLGATIGGPVFIPGKFNKNRDKLFFFFSEEHWRIRLPDSVTRLTMPTELERRGDFSQTIDQNGRRIDIRDPLTNQTFPGNIIPSSRINKNGQGLLGVLPLPNQLNRTLTAGAYNYEFQNVQEVPKTGHLLKLDWHPTERDIVTIRPRTWRADTRAYGGLAGFMPGTNPKWPLAYHRYLFTEQSANAAWTRTLNPSTVNEINIGFRGLKEIGHPETADEFKGAIRSTYGVTLGQFNPQINPYNFVPEMSFGGVPSAPNLVIDRRTPIDAGDSRFHFSDNVSWIRGAHTMKFGFYMERNWTSEGSRGTSFMGSFDFGRDVNNPGDTNWAFSNALVGNFRQYAEANSRTRGLGYNTLLEWFAQDTWKVTRKLTLNYGLRFSWYTPWFLREGEGAGLATERYDPAKAPVFYQPAMNGNQRMARNPLTGQFAPQVFIGAFVPGSGDPYNGIVVGTDESYPRGFINQQPVQVAPRFGFAYDVFGNGKTALRGGFGINKQAMPNVGDYTSNMALNPPVQERPVIFYGNMDTLQSASGVLFPNNVNSWDPNAVTPSVYNYSFGIQQNIGFDTVLDVSYVGNVGRHLMQSVNLNTLPYGARFLPQNADPTNPRVALPDNMIRPMPGYGNITYVENSGTSNYNSLQVTANRRFAAGLQFGLAYTWSKAMGLASGETGAIARWNDRRVWNYGRLTFDQTHMAVINYTWDIPNVAKNGNAVLRHLLGYWQFSGVTTFASGTPRGIGMSLTDNTDLVGGGDGVRANVIDTVPLPSSERTFSRWFNTASVARPAVGDRGNAAPNLFDGPGVNNWDLNIMKRIPVAGEQRFFRIRGEFYNAFNHAQFSGVDNAARFDPAGRQVNARFGELTSTRSPRIVQLSLSFHF